MDNFKLNIAQTTIAKTATSFAETEIVESDHDTYSITGKPNTLSFDNPDAFQLSSRKSNIFEFTSTVEIENELIYSPDKSNILLRCSKSNFIF